jgi:hypothetical protein
MSATPIALPNEPDSSEPRRLAPERYVVLDIDELGITVRAALRLTGPNADVRDLLQTTPTEQHASLVERAMIVGLTTIASASEVTAIDVARMKLVDAADRVTDTIERFDRQQEQRTSNLEICVKGLVEDTRKAMKDGRDEEKRLREEITRRSEELAKASKAMDVSRGELERKTSQAISDMVTAQGVAKDAMLKATEQTLRKLVDHDDPGSAPALIKNVVDNAASSMRDTTAKNVAELEDKLKGLLGEASPFAERIAKLAREGAERELKQVVDLLDKLRVDVIAARTRQDHDPNVKGDGYEDDVLDLLKDAASVYGLTPVKTGTEVGASLGSRKGDHLLLDEALVPVAAVEARARKNVTSRELLEGMAATAVNREVKIVAYFARSEDELPSGLGEFSRGRLPMTYKRLPDDVHALVCLIDPTQSTVPERLALVLWVIHRLREQAAVGPGNDDAAQRIEHALPCMAQLVTHLGMFRAVKSGLTQAGTAIQKAKGKIEEIEATLKVDVAHVDAVLNGVEDDSL